MIVLLAVAAVVVGVIALAIVNGAPRGRGVYRGGPGPIGPPPAGPAPGARAAGNVPGVRSPQQQPPRQPQG